MDHFGGTDAETRIVIKPIFKTGCENAVVIEPAQNNFPCPNVPEAKILTLYSDILCRTAAERSCRFQNNANYLLVIPYN
jgi:hypothetical protein